METAIGTGEGVLVALLILVIVGGVIGWLAGLIVKGSGLGLVGDVVVGILGSILGGRLLPAAGLSLGGGLLGAILTGVIGAVIVLLVIRLIRRV